MNTNNKKGLGLLALLLTGAFIVRKNKEKLQKQSDSLKIADLQKQIDELKAKPGEPASSKE